MVKTSDPFLIHHIAFVLARKSERLLEERLRVGLSQFRILSSIDVNPKFRQRDIAESLNQTEAGISRQVKVLYKKGLLKTSDDPKDRRQHKLKITPKGAEIVAAARKIFNEVYADIKKGMGRDQVEQLARSCANLHKAICPNGSSCSYPQQNSGPA